ncbi:hypothetical protein ACNF42_07480 [Cuniculiplasma sp. SKW3]|uniref:hypothetical protein n=1 Tax=Cuniculiplasma sp. SKW3 TaxID=3400170 RepID=UPI003FCFC4A9
MENREIVIRRGEKPQQEIAVHYDYPADRRGTLERLQEKVIENTVNRYEAEERRIINEMREFMERNPDISYLEYESNPVFRIDLTITKRGLIFRREEATISATITPNRRFRAQR